MNIHTNHIMQKIIDISNLDLNSISLYSRLQKMLDSGVIELEGYYFLKSQIIKEIKPNLIIHNFLDKTDLECDVNHIHIDKSKKYRQDILKQGIKFSFELCKLLEKLGKFEIILGYSTSNFEECNIRFHKIRDDEIPYIGEIEKFEDEAMLVIHT